MKRSVLFWGLAFVIVLFIASTSRAGGPVSMGAPVKVTNTKANPVPVTLAPKPVTPVWIMVGGPDTYTVPEKKRLVVEYLSCEFYAPATDAVNCGIKTPSRYGAAWLPGSPKVVRSAPAHYTGGVLKAYYKAGDLLQPAGDAIDHIYIEGYLEDVE